MGSLACADVEVTAQEKPKEKPIRIPKMGRAGISRAIRESLHSSAVVPEIEEIVAELLPMQATQVLKQILQKVVPLSGQS